MKKSSNSLFVLRGGFAAILLLLAASAFEAFQLQTVGGPEQQAAYRRFLEKDEAITAFRRAVWLGGLYTRDYFLSPSAAGQERFAMHVQELETQGQQALAKLRTLDPVVVESHRLHQELAMFIHELRAAPGSPNSYIETVLVPRRLSAFALIEEVRSDGREELVRAQDRYLTERAGATRTLVFLLIASLAIGAAVAFFSLRIATRVERERYVHSLELEKLSTRLLEIQEEERRSLSRELHDEVGQSLTALRMEISHAMTVLPDSDARVRLARARELAERTVRMVRDISLLLRPSLLDDLGLGAALQWQFEDFSRRSGIRTEFDGADLGETLSDVTKTCVFRIAQEALHNCEKYSQARTVRVVLAQDERSLVLEVQDDGVGFSLSDRGLPSQGTGILGIKERAQKLGGTLAVESRPNAGTRIAVRLPIEATPAVEVYN
jgi:signal transduction histidine kinase